MGVVVSARREIRNKFCLQIKDKVIGMILSVIPKTQKDGKMRNKYNVHAAG